MNEIKPYWQNYVAGKWCDGQNGARNEAMAIANGTDFGLCAGVYARDLERAHRTADRLTAGQVFVNEWFAGGIETPFGGMKRSGYGREKGQEALHGYTQTKNIAIKLGAGGAGRPGG